MSCAGFARLLSGHIDDNLSPREHASLMEHLSQCPPCASRLARYRQMDLTLRRLPYSTPAPVVRERVLAGIAPAIRSLSLRPWAALTGVLTMLALIIGVLVPGSTVLDSGTSVGPALTKAYRPDGPLIITGVAERSPELGQRDVVFLQEMGRTVGRAGFRPMMPGYLPIGWHVDRVQIGRMQPAEPIDQVEVAFGANGKQLRLWQLRGAAADARRGQLPPDQWRAARSVLAAGIEWLYLAAGTVNGSEPTGILVGQRNGITIWLESSMPMDEMTKVAASLQE